jgi:hypothetical protein
LDVGVFFFGAAIRVEVASTITLAPIRMRRMA